MTSLTRLEARVMNLFIESGFDGKQPPTKEGVAELLGEKVPSVGSTLSVLCSKKNLLKRSRPQYQRTLYYRLPDAPVPYGHNDLGWEPLAIKSPKKEEEEAPQEPSGITINVNGFVLTLTQAKALYSELQEVFG